MVSSPPAMIVGRRMRTQRLSIFRWSSRPVAGSAAAASSWFTGSKRRMISPSTPIARGIQISLAEGGGDPLGDARLAVARRAEQEQPAAGIDRRPEPVEHLLAQQQAVEGAVQVVGRGVLVGERLGVDAGDVVGQRDRRRAEVGAVLRVAAGPARGPGRSAGTGSRSSAPSRDGPTSCSFFISRSNSSISTKGSLTWSAMSRPVASPRASRNFRISASTSLSVRPAARNDAGSIGVNASATLRQPLAARADRAAGRRLGGQPLDPFDAPRRAWRPIRSTGGCVAVEFPWQFGSRWGQIKSSFSHVGAVRSVGRACRCLERLQDDVPGALPQLDRRQQLSSAASCQRRDCAAASAGDALVPIASGVDARSV